MKQNNNKTYTIYAGVNGAGKSTIYTTVEINPQEERVNSDEILTSNGGDWRNEKDQILAMREAVKRINHFINEGISFNQETTLAGRSILRTIEKAKKQGFSVRMLYIGLNSADLAVERVNARVKKGGHGIEESVIRKRYETSFSMLREVLPLCDVAVIYDNSKELDIVAKYADKAWTLLDRNCEWLNKAVPEVVKAAEMTKEESKDSVFQSMGIHE